MEGLSHRHMLPRPPRWVWEGGCGGSMFVFYVCIVPPRNADGFEDDVVWRGCPTGIRYPRHPLWVWEGGCGGSMFVFYACTPRNGDGFQDDVRGGAVP